MGKVLVLTDGKAGHENQSKAFARALGCEFELVGVRFKSRFHKALSYLLDRLGVRTLDLFDPGVRRCAAAPAAGYAAVLGTGSGTFYAAKALARALGVKCGVVLYPRGYDLASFDCVLAPAFDRPKSAANVVEIPANLVAADAEFYAKGVAAFRERTAVEPEVAVVVGGPNRCATLSVAQLRDWLEAIFREPGRKAVTTSRRTPPAVEALVDSYPWDYKLIYSRDHFNPIPAFVTLAKRIYVTAESTGMLSEACTFGSAEVKVLDNLRPGPHKFRRFVEDLRHAGHVDGRRKIDLSAPFARARALMGL
ncbi:MAG: ELM1/GtrOC1 family putative glycosyltransferase [Kiritimatiellia bacterium]